MRDFLSFLWAVASQWLVLMGGAAVITVLGIIERFRGKDISVRLYIVLMLLFVFYASFLAWKDQHENATSAERDLQGWQAKHEALRVAKERADAALESKEQRIQVLSDKLQDAIRSRPVEVKVEGSAAPPEPVLTEGLRVSHRRIPSPKEDAPFAVEVTVQVNAAVQPMGLLITCDRELADGHFHLVGQAMQSMVRVGVVGPTRNQFYVGFASPAVTPQSPLVVTLIAKSAFRVLKVERVTHQ